MGNLFVPGPLGGLKSVQEDIYGHTDSIGSFFMNIFGGFTLFCSQFRENTQNGQNRETSSSLSVLKTVKIAKNQAVNFPHFWSQIREILVNCSWLVWHVFTSIWQFFNSLLYKFVKIAKNRLISSPLSRLKFVITVKTQAISSCPSSVKF